jgi:transcriptional regulator with XRE-family HTH domain
MNGKWCRAARALLNWSQAELAAKAGIGHNTLQNFETSSDFASTSPATVAAIRRALEAGGAIFRADGVDSADQVIDRYNSIKNPTPSQTAEAIIAAGVVRRAGGRRKMPEGKAAEVLEAARFRSNKE